MFHSTSSDPAGVGDSTMTHGAISTSLEGQKVRRSICPKWICRGEPSRLAFEGMITFEGRFVHPSLGRVPGGCEVPLRLCAGWHGRGGQRCCAHHECL